MTKEEWITEFQVLNGRFPTQAEIQAATANQFQQTKSSGFQKFDSNLLLKIALIILMAVFGYVVGYLFV
ncbi:hypothetical protein [Streptococcus jiangjianxini]|uniref:hypothetical protein n=1 Tax=Streptococcus jiangjianxini TaxID=3161189 RepID=UPI0032ED4D28